MPATRELIVEDAFTKGWAQTAVEVNAAAKTLEELGD